MVPRQSPESHNTSPAKGHCLICGVANLYAALPTDMADLPLYFCDKKRICQFTTVEMSETRQRVDTGLTGLGDGIAVATLVVSGGRLI